MLALDAVDELLVELLLAADVEVAAAPVPDVASVPDVDVALADAELPADGAGMLEGTVRLPGGSEVVPPPWLGSFAARAAMIDCQGAGKPVVERVGGWPGFSW